MGGQLGMESRTPGMDPAPIRTEEVTVTTIAALMAEAEVAVMEVMVEVAVMEVMEEEEVNRSRPRRYSQAASREVVPLHHVSQWATDWAGSGLADLKSPAARRR